MASNKVVIAVLFIAMVTMFAASNVVVADDGEEIAYQECYENGMRLGATEESVKRECRNIVKDHDTKLVKIEPQTCSNHISPPKALLIGSPSEAESYIWSLIGVDPADGMDKGKQTPPAVLTYVPHSFNNLDMPVMVTGSGLGEVKRNPFFPACATKGVNHRDFYNECFKPACYLTKGIRGKATYCLCKQGKSREPMRRFVGGVLLAFLEGNSNDLIAIRDGHVTLPVELQDTDFRV
ncbi:hypothetical protein K7X08_004800 [Anisodus acutangulus]|uniref:Uncharacterized protein n=1 Tax=Anisodus acutangulus TaxID=402998 RepID=A0A9Q1MFS7_9SOLA|nr:hypothetical protein K7X08_004800 [Anisodus acutangulus]